MSDILLNIFWGVIGSCMIAIWRLNSKTPTLIAGVTIIATSFIFGSVTLSIISTIAIAAACFINSSSC